MVIAKINKTQVMDTKVSKKPHIESASSSIPASLPPPTSLATEANMLKLTLFRKRFIITGSIIRAIEITARTPQELLIKEMLVETVRNASFMDGPTIGAKLLIANRAVFKERESAP